MSNNKAILHKDIQSLICKLPDIISCSVICDKEGTIEEIHVLAAVGRNIKQMVRDIQSAINAKFNISVDYKKISIAQINEAEFKETRVRIEGIQVKNVNNAIEAEVALSYDDKVYQGRSSKVKSRSNRAKAVAEATLAALEACIGISGVLYLEAVSYTHLTLPTIYSV